MISASAKSHFGTFCFHSFATLFFWQASKRELAARREQEMLEDARRMEAGATRAADAHEQLIKERQAAERVVAEARAAEKRAEEAKLKASALAKATAEAEAKAEAEAAAMKREEACLHTPIHPPKPSPPALTPPPPHPPHSNLLCSRDGCYCLGCGHRPPI